MKHLLAGLILTTGYVYSMEKITMPTKQIIIKRLVSSHLEIYLVNSPIASQLADKEKTPAEVVTAIDESFNDVHRSLAAKTTPAVAVKLMVHMRVLKPKIIKALLQDEPGALDDLARQGLYVPGENI